MSSKARGEGVLDSGSTSSTGFSEFDAEYACSDHAMVRQVVQAAVRNYFASSCTALARLTLCLDFTEGAPVPNNKTPFVRYQAPLVQISVERKSGPGSTTTAQSTTLRAAAKSSEKGSGSCSTANTG
ncbi:unnamed protein product [Gongylonema pulchrum]|uniref:HORMA domain-containing protein n=1 Tax=Gongylonema pulchrum TaxID=637853 RepID=A0A183DIN5_9BILA|nr:unnamed protein product [Gongylonema pulchrum]